MRFLILTSSGGTAHDSAAWALRDWIQRERKDASVTVDSVLENASPFTRGGVDLYNWIQRRHPVLHHLYWRLVEFEDLSKPGTVLVGRRHLIRLLRESRPDVLVSTHPHINRGHFNLAKRVLGPGLRCVTSCTELAGGFGFTRNWVSAKADLFWTITEEAAEGARAVRHLFPLDGRRIQTLGPLLHPAYHDGERAPEELKGRPRLVLGSGSNSANNHVDLLEQLLPFSATIDVVVLCGRRLEVAARVRAWSFAHPGMRVQPLGFQDADAMAGLYRGAFGLVARAGARTATESLFMGCPLIFNNWGGAMPQERLAVRYFEKRGLEASVHAPGDLARQVGAWLENPRQYQALRRRYREHRLEADPARILRAVEGAA